MHHTTPRAGSDGGALSDPNSVAFQAIEKLRVRSAVRGKIVSVYRQCLFALKVGAGVVKVAFTFPRSRAGAFTSVATLSTTD
jgi:hypothetical protein